MFNNPEVFLSLLGISGVKPDPHTETGVVMGDTDSSGFEGSLYLQSLQSVPVYPAEKRMLPQLSLCILSSTQTLSRVLGEELGEKQMEKECQKNRDRKGGN